MLKKIEIERLKVFERDFKKLSKKYRTLEDDLQTFIKYQLNPFHLTDHDNKGIEHISDLGITYPKIYKVTKFACKSLKGRGVKSGIRIIYAYFEDENRTEFVEIYFKANKELEDRKRIIDLYG